jgi:hypothetical protein
MAQPYSAALTQSDEGRPIMAGDEPSTSFAVWIGETHLGTYATREDAKAALMRIAEHPGDLSPREIEMLEVRRVEAIADWDSSISIGGRDIADIHAEIDKWRAEFETWRAKMEVWHKEVEDRRKEFEEWRAEVEKWRAERDTVVRGSEGGKSRSRRPWAPYALPIVKSASPGVSDNSITLRMRDAWKKHPKWPALPKTDRAIHTWVSEQRRPKYPEV